MGAIRESMVWSIAVPDPADLWIVLDEINLLNKLAETHMKKLENILNYLVIFYLSASTFGPQN